MNELEIIEMKKIALRYMLNVTYGGITTVKPNEEQLTKILKEYKDVKMEIVEYEFEIDGQNIIGKIENNKLTIPNHYENEPLTKCEVDKHGCIWCFFNGGALIGLPLD